MYEIVTIPGLQMGNTHSKFINVTEGLKFDPSNLKAAYSLIREQHRAFRGEQSFAEEYILKRILGERRIGLEVGIRLSCYLPISAIFKNGLVHFPKGLGIKSYCFYIRALSFILFYDRVWATYYQIAVAPGPIFKKMSGRYVPNITHFYRSFCNARHRVVVACGRGGRDGLGKV